MRKFIKPLTALCCFTMLFASLCACSGETEKTIPEGTSKHETKEQREAPKTETELSIAFGAVNADDSTDTESENGVTITGETLSPDQLTDFSYTTDWAESVMTNGYAGAFLDTLDNAELKDLYRHALALVHLISTDNIIPTDKVIAQGNERTQLILDGEYGYYVESGYTYESFREAYYSVFTKETADTIFSRYPNFYSYNGEMWYRYTSAGGSIGEVFQEYELTNQTDTELEFKRISYSVAIGEPITDYDPDKKDEYRKTEVEFRFIKTADGWRAEKFLNATDYDRSMLPA